MEDNGHLFFKNFFWGVGVGGGVNKLHFGLDENGE